MKYNKKDIHDLLSLLLSLHNQDREKVHISFFVEEQVQEWKSFFQTFFSTQFKEITMEVSSCEFRDEVAAIQIERIKYHLSFSHEKQIYLSRIGDFSCKIYGDSKGILVWHQDQVGVVQQVTDQLAQRKINIQALQVSRESRGKKALLCILTDQSVSPSVEENIQKGPFVHKVENISYH